MKKKHSIKDIAKALNVSITSVSFVLNGKAQEKGISKELAGKINDYARSINYKPNALARSFRTGKTNTLALLVEDISNPFFGLVARNVEEILYEHGYKILYCSTDNQLEKAVAQLNMFKDRYVDGYIMSPPPGMEEQLAELVEENTPIVLFDRRYEHLDINFVGVDNYGASQQATTFLIDKGYKKICYVTIGSDQCQIAQRQAAYADTLRQAGLPTKILTVPFTLDHEGISGIMVDFIKENREDVDAFFFATNYLGKYGLEAFKKLGMKLPDDVGVVSFDDQDIFRLYNPSVTAIEQPVKEIAERIVELLLESIAAPDNSTSKQEVILPVKLIVRDSTR